MKLGSALISRLLCYTATTILSLLKPTSTKARTPIMKVKFGKTPGKVLFDTGAEVSILSSSMYQRCKNYCTDLPTSRMIIRSASGDKIPVLATTILKLYFNGKIREGAFQVVPHISNCDGILGTDFMTRNSVTISLGSNKINFGPLRKLKTEAYKITNENKITIDPKQEKLIYLLDSVRPQEKECMVEHVGKRESIHYMDCLTTKITEDDKVYIPCVLSNPTQNTVILQPKEITWEITPQKELYVCKMENLTSSPTQPVRSDAEDFVQKNADLSHVPNHMKEKFKSLLISFSDVFSRNHIDVGHCKSLPHEIVLKDPNKVVNIPPYRSPHFLQELQHEYVHQLLDAQIIRASTSPFSSHLMMVKKANADPNLPISTQYRVVHNYKKVNENIKPCSYPLSNLYSLIDEVSQGKYYTVLDLSQGYFNQKVIDKHGATAFSVPGLGTFEYLRSPMGINSSPAYFQRLMEFVIKGLSRVYVYLDDIIISTNDIEEHYKTLEQTLLRLRIHNLKLNLRKAHFGKIEVTYLGYQISNSTIKPGERKTKAITIAKTPTNVKQIRQFIGLCSFFRKCVPNFSKIASPLNSLIRKTSGYLKGPLPAEALASFRLLQKSLATQPTLKPVDFTKTFIVTVDTSDDSHGALLSQKHDNGVEYPCAYASQTIGEGAKKKAAFHKEKLGVRWALRHFKPYLIGKSFIIRTDHKPLLFLKKGRIQELDSVSSDILEYLPFEVEYMPGDKIPADYFSRPVNAISRDKTKSKINLQSETKPLTENQFPEFNLTVDRLYEAQQLDTRLKAIVCKIKYKIWPQNELLKSFITAMLPDCRIADDGILEDRKGRAFLPPSLRENVLKKAHDSMGHFATEKTLSILSKYFVWETMHKDVENYCKSCKICQQSRPPYSYGVLPLGKFPNSTIFNDRIHMDCITNLKPSLSTGNKCILVIVDSYSGYTMAKGIKNPSAAEVAKVFLQSWISSHGFPRQIISDGGSEFRNDTLKSIANYFQIEHIQTPAMISRTNGKVERKNRDIVEFLRKYLNNFNYKQTDWEELLPGFCVSNNITRSTHGFPPHFCVYGQQPNLPSLDFRKKGSHYNEQPWAAKCRSFAETSEAVTSWKNKNFKENEKQFAKKPKLNKLFQGDLVYLLVSGKHTPKLNRKYSGPFIILDFKGSMAEIRAPRSSARPFLAHLERLKKGTFRDPIFLDASSPNQNDIYKKKENKEHDIFLSKRGFKKDNMSDCIFDDPQDPEGDPQPAEGEDDPPDVPPDDPDVPEPDIEPEADIPSPPLSGRNSPNSPIPPADNRHHSNNNSDNEDLSDPPDGAAGGHYETVDDDDDDDDDEFATPIKEPLPRKPPAIAFLPFDSVRYFKETSDASIPTDFVLDTGSPGRPFPDVANTGARPKTSHSTLARGGSRDPGASKQPVRPTAPPDSRVIPGTRRPDASKNPGYSGRHAGGTTSRPAATHPAVRLPPPAHGTSTTRTSTTTTGTGGPTERRSATSGAPKPTSGRSTLSKLKDLLTPEKDRPGSSSQTGAAPARTTRARAKQTGVPVEEFPLDHDPNKVAREAKKKKQATRENISRR